MDTKNNESRTDDFAKIVRASCGKQVLFFKEVCQDEGNIFHSVVSFSDVFADMKMSGLPDEAFATVLDKADSAMADQAIQEIKDLGFGEE